MNKPLFCGETEQWQTMEDKTKVFTLAGRVLRNLFQKPATVQYPFQPVEYPERMRGHVTIEIASCISCGLCQRSCPSNAIQVDRAAGTWTINRFDCVQCGSCVAACPKKCLSMNKGYTKPEVAKTSETFTRPKEEKPAAASSGSGKPVCDAEKCVYCTLCAKKCPQEALLVDRKEHIWKLDEEKCVQCGLCASSCPKHAIQM